MVRFSKRVRDRLKADGEWDSRPHWSTAEVDAFVQGAADANRVVPFSGLREDDRATVMFTPAQIGFWAKSEMAFSAVTSDLSFYGPTSVERKPQVVAAMFIVFASKVARSNEMCAVSSHSIPIVDIPVDIVQFIKPFGHFHMWNHDFVFQDPPSLVKALLRAANLLLTGSRYEDVLESLWLPTSTKDTRSTLVVAQHICAYGKSRGYNLSISGISKCLYSGFVPQQNYSALCDLFPVEQLVWLFREFKDGPQFVKNFTASNEVYRRIGLNHSIVGLGFLAIEKSIRDFTIDLEKVAPNVPPGTPGFVRSSDVVDIVEGAAAQALAVTGDAVILPSGVTCSYDLGCYAFAVGASSVLSVEVKSVACSLPNGLKPSDFVL